MLKLSVLCCLVLSSSAIAIPNWSHPALNDKNASWDPATATFSITQDVSFGDDNVKEEFYWNIPSQIKTLLIKKNVTVTGHFRFTADTTIQGEDWNTSIIKGTDTIGWAHGPNAKPEPGNTCQKGPVGDDRVHDCEKWQYGAISVARTAPKNVSYKVRNLKVINARTYAITSINHALDLDHVKILHKRGNNDLRSNSDGFGGGKNSRITNSYIDTWDDSIKLYKDGMHIENVTIIHNGNGAPFQFGWSNKEPASFTIKNVLVKKGAEKVKGGFNMALFTNAGGTVTPSIQIDGLVAHYNDGLLLTHSRMDKPIPIVYFRGTPKSVANLHIKEGSVFQVKTGQASYGPGKLLINGQESGLTGIYEQGDASQVTGCGCSEND